MQKDTYTVALIIIGNEILSGRTQDSNTAWIAEQLNAMGVVLHQVRVVPDTEEEIVSAIHELKEGDVLVIAGKGHEQGQVFASHTEPFDDFEEAERAIDA